MSYIYIYSAVQPVVLVPSYSRKARSAPFVASDRSVRVTMPAPFTAPGRQRRLLATNPREDFGPKRGAP